MHPNLVTLTGFVPVMLCAAWFGCTNSAAIPAPMYLLAAGLMFFYQTMDCLDGIQARKLQLSSPLGQLFDHGLDAIVITFGLLFLVKAVGLDYSDQTLSTNLDINTSGSSCVDVSPTTMNAGLVALVLFGGHANFLLHLVARAAPWGGAP